LYCQNRKGFKEKNCKEYCFERIESCAADILLARNKEQACENSKVNQKPEGKMLVQNV